MIVTPLVGDGSKDPWTLFIKQWLAATLGGTLLCFWYVSWNPGNAVCANFDCSTSDGQIFANVSFQGTGRRAEMME